MQKMPNQIKKRNIKFKKGTSGKITHSSTYVRSFVFHLQLLKMSNCKMYM